VSGIRWGEKGAGQRITYAAKESAVAQSVIAGIFMRDRGDNGFREEGGEDAETINALV
jgi:hypothetical protein